MKYWESNQYNMGYSSAEGIAMVGKDNDNRVISIEKSAEYVEFFEANEGYFSIYLPKQDAIKALEEAIEWIKGDKDV